jgi:hypothetical protein
MAGRQAGWAANGVPGLQWRRKSIDIVSNINRNPHFPHTLYRRRPCVFMMNERHAFYMYIFKLEQGIMGIECGMNTCYVNTN